MLTPITNPVRKVAAGVGDPARERIGAEVVEAHPIDERLVGRRARKRRGLGLPGCGRGVTVPSSTNPKPSAAQPRMATPSLSKPAPRPTRIAEAEAQELDRCAAGVARGDAGGEARRGRARGRMPPATRSAPSVRWWIARDRRRRGAAVRRDRRRGARRSPRLSRRERAGRPSPPDRPAEAARPHRRSRDGRGRATCTRATPRRRRPAGRRAP